MKLVLIVDDSETERVLMGNVVKESGHLPEFADNGLKGMDLAKTMKPSLILMDVVMAHQDGFATCRKLKKDPDTAEIPIVLVTSKNSSVSKYWGEQQGADAYVTKPFTKEELSTVIKKFI